MNKIILILILLGSLTLHAQQGVTLYIFAQSTCPHCHNLISFLQANNYNVIIYYVDKDITAYERFKEYTAETRLPPYVPQTIVVRNGQILAIVIGENENNTFWQIILDKQPSTSVTVYEGQKIYTTLQIYNQTAFILKYFSSNMRTSSGVQTQSMQNDGYSPNLFIVAGVVLIFIALIMMLVMYIKR